MSNTTLKPAKLVTITPELAQKILNEKNVINRRLRDWHVDDLARDMREGKWKINGDTICLGQTRLIDGQHRLWAVVLSGVTIQAYVVEGLADDVFDTKDLGKRRTAADTLDALGEKNTPRLAAALAMIDRYMTGRAHTSVKYSNSDILGLLEKYPGIREAQRTEFKISGLLPGSVVDACYYLFSRVDKRLADEFIDKLKRGAGLEEGSPWYVLRERLMHNSVTKAKLTKPYQFALTVKAWNCARDGKKIKQLRWRDKGPLAEPFPVIR